MQFDSPTVTLPNSFDADQCWQLQFECYSLQMVSSKRHALLSHKILSIQYAIYGIAIDPLTHIYLFR